MITPDRVFDLEKDTELLDVFYKEHYNSIGVYVLSFIGIPIYVGASAQIGERTRRFTYKNLPRNKYDPHNRLMRFMFYGGKSGSTLEIYFCDLFDVKKAEIMLSHLLFPISRCLSKRRAQTFDSSRMFNHLKFCKELNPEYFHNYIKKSPKCSFKGQLEGVCL